MKNTPVVAKHRRRGTAYILAEETPGGFHRVGTRRSYPQTWLINSGDVELLSPTPSVESWEETAALTAVNAWSAKNYSAFSTIIYQGIKEAVASTERRVREEALDETEDVFRKEYGGDFMGDGFRVGKVFHNLRRLKESTQPPAETQPTDQ